jgi:hypothetical protein
MIAELGAMENSCSLNAFSWIPFQYCIADDRKLRIEVKSNNNPGCTGTLIGSSSFTMAAVQSKRRTVDTAAIIAELEAERNRINVAIDALQGSTSGRGRGRAAAKHTNGRKRHLSAAARKLISEAMKKRWAARKKVA